jgi:oligopeptide/dipeptide ABC transporter ATP-binding protein
MYLGKIVETVPAGELDQAGRHPYTEALLAAAPTPDPSRPLGPPPIGGDAASPLDPPAGCRFHPRCPEARKICRREEPALKESAPGSLCACHMR